MTDGQDIVELLWQRREEAISRMQSEYERYCYSISWQIVKNREDVHECLNDTWLQTWNSIPRNRPQSLRAYVAKSIRNLSLSRIVHEHAWKRGRGEVQVVYDELEEMLGGEDPIQHMIDEQVFAAVVNEFLDGLNPLERGIFVLRFWYFCKPAQIAEKYRIREQTVYNMLYRLRKEFREHWLREVGY